VFAGPSVEFDEHGWGRVFWEVWCGAKRWGWEVVTSGCYRSAGDLGGSILRGYSSVVVVVVCRGVLGYGLAVGGMGRIKVSRGGGLKIREGWDSVKLLRGPGLWGIAGRIGSLWWFDLSVRGTLGSDVRSGGARDLHGDVRGV